MAESSMLDSSSWGYNAYYSSTLMAGDDSAATMQAIASLLRLVRDVAQTSATGFKGRFKKDCTDLSRRVALLSHLVEEIRDFQADRASSSPSFLSSISRLTAALEAARMLLQYAGGYDHINPPEIGAVEWTSEFQHVTRKLECALATLPYDDLDISKDVKEQVDLVRGQLKKPTEDGVKISKVLKSSDSVKIPDDFLCPISLEMMRDPVIVSTGQTYERSYIQSWIKRGKRTCPKTFQKLKNKDLTPNYVLRSLIAQWCEDHDVEKPILPNNKSIIGKPSRQDQRPGQHMKDVVCLAYCALFAFCSMIVPLLHDLKYNL